MCSLLLEHGAEVDQQAKNGLAALHLAAQEDRVSVAQLLVKNGAEVLPSNIIIVLDYSFKVEGYYMTLFISM